MNTFVKQEETMQVEWLTYNKYVDEDNNVEWRAEIDNIRLELVPPIPPQHEEDNTEYEWFCYVSYEYQDAENQGRRCFIADGSNPKANEAVKICLNQLKLLGENINKVKNACGAY